MKIKTEIENLQQNDIYSLMLFALFKISGDPKQASLSQLCYILDKDNLLKLCEFFGGMTLRIPTIEELETLIYSLLMYQQIDIEHKLYEEVEKDIRTKYIDFNAVFDGYKAIKQLLAEYNFNSGRN